MRPLPDVRDDGDPVEGEARDGQFQRQPDEAGHRVVEQDLRGQRELDVPRVLDAADDLEVLGSALAHAPGRKGTVCGGGRVVVQLRVALGMCVEGSGGVAAGAA